jgi:hypothetical protein
MKHCDHKVLETLDLNGLFDAFELEEARKIKKLEQLYLTFLQPRFKINNWGWTRDRPQL